MLITKLQTILASFILVKVKKNLRKSQAQFREKLRKLKLKQNYGFLIKKRVINLSSVVSATPTHGVKLKLAYPLPYS